MRFHTIDISLVVTKRKHVENVLRIEMPSDLKCITTMSATFSENYKVTTCTNLAYEFLKELNKHQFPSMH